MEASDFSAEISTEFGGDSPRSVKASIEAVCGYFEKKNCFAIQRKLQYRIATQTERIKIIIIAFVTSYS